MQPSHPSSLMSYAISRHARWFFFASASAAGLIAIWLAGASLTRPAAAPGGVLRFERNQAEQTMSALGYQDVSGLEKHGDGSWRAKAQKNGTHWQVRISSYGIVSAHLAPQLGIVLE